MADADEAAEVLRGAEAILLIDWPSRDVPERLARVGFAVFADEGPSTGYTAYETRGDEVVMRSGGEAPAHADIVYSHRPIEELPDIVDRAVDLGARAIWLQSGLDENGKRDLRGCWLPAQKSELARSIVESAGLAYIEAPYIADAAGAIG